MYAQIIKYKFNYILHLFPFIFILFYTGWSGRLIVLIQWVQWVHKGTPELKHSEKIYKIF